MNTRREVISLLGGAAAGWPITGRARAQQQEAAKVYTIGVLALAAPSPERLLAALRQGLSEAGYIEGRNLRFEIRTEDASPSSLQKRPPSWFVYRSTLLSRSSHRLRWLPSRRRARFRS
jgi:hypothetical protein